MNFYNTGNPVPSNDPRDLDDNAKNLDLALNSVEPSFVDRNGVLRKTINGYGDAFSAFLSLQGWSTLGVYSAGISIISHSQVVEYQGQSYALKASVPASISSPYITTGNWTTESANFKLVGDNSLRQELASGDGGQLVSFLQSGDGAKPRSVSERLRDTVSVKDFGAVGNGVGDDTAAIQAAIDHLNTIGGGKLSVPPGVYIASKLTVYSNIWIFGSGREISTIKLKTGANTDLIYGDLADSLWGTNSGSGIQGFGLFDISLDGNRANNLTAGSVVAVYGEELYFSNLFVKNARDHGIKTEWGDGGSVYGMESYFENVRIDNCGKHGWDCNGPHDSVFINLIVIDASVNTDKTYHGIYLGPRMNGRFVGCHVWNRSTSYRHSAAVLIDKNGGGNEFSACHFEGAWNANVMILCSGNTLDESCNVYAPWNGVNVYLGQTATLNVIKARLGQPGAGRPDCTGVTLGGNVTDFVADNIIDVYCTQQKNGDVDVANSGGFNKIRIRGYKSSGNLLLGSPKVTDSIDADVHIGGSQTLINSERQKVRLPISASTTVSWVFPFAFVTTPCVTFSPESPSGPITSGIWISAIGPNDVTINNNNAVSMTLNITAEKI